MIPIITTTRPATAMDIAMLTIEKAVADGNCVEAHIKAKNLARICNAIALEGVVLIDSDQEKLHRRIQRESLHRPYLFLSPELPTQANVDAMKDMEFEPDGFLVQVRRKTTAAKGTRT